MKKFDKYILVLPDFLKNILFWLLFTFIVLLIWMFIVLNGPNKELKNIIIGALYAAIAAITGILLQQYFSNLSENQKRGRFIVQQIFEINQNINLMDSYLKIFKGGSQKKFKGYLIGHLERFKAIREYLFDFTSSSFEEYQKYIDYIENTEKSGKNKMLTEEQYKQHKSNLLQFIHFLRRAEKNSNNFDLQ